MQVENWTPRWMAARLLQIEVECDHLAGSGPAMAKALSHQDPATTRHQVDLMPELIGLGLHKQAVGSCES